MERDPFALGGYTAAPPAAALADDAEILLLFRRWCEELRAAEACPGEFDDSKVTPLEEQIFDAPARGSVGLAIKGFMLAFEICQADLATEHHRGQDVCSLGRLNPNDGNYSYRYDARTDTTSDTRQLYVGRHAILGLLASAVRFLPELEPLVAGVLSSPRFLPPEDDEQQGDAP